MGINEIREIRRIMSGLMIRLHRGGIVRLNRDYDGGESLNGESLRMLKVLSLEDNS